MLQLQGRRVLQVKELSSISQSCCVSSSLHNMFNRTREGKVMSWQTYVTPSLVIFHNGDCLNLEYDGNLLLFDVFHDLNIKISLNDIISLTEGSSEQICQWNIIMCKLHEGIFNYWLNNLMMLNVTTSILSYKDILLASHKPAVKFCFAHYVLFIFPVVCSSKQFLKEPDSHFKKSNENMQHSTCDCSVGSIALCTEMTNCYSVCTFLHSLLCF